jgi:hypothetical protein
MDAAKLRINRAMTPRPRDKRQNSACPRTANCSGQVPRDECENKLSQVRWRAKLESDEFERGAISDRVSLRRAQPMRCLDPRASDSERPRREQDRDAEPALAHENFQAHQ